MTTGNVVIGAENSSYYYRRIWNGTNGIVHDTPTIQAFYRWRKVRSAFTVEKTKTYRRAGQTFHWFNKPVKIRAQYIAEYVCRIRHHKSRVTQTEHPYTVSFRHGSNHKGTDPVAGNWIPLTNTWETPPAWTSNNELVVLARLSDKVKGHSFNLGVALGEGRETTRMLLGTLSRLTGAIVDLKKGRIDLALRRLGAVPHKKHMGSKAIRSKPLHLTDVSNMWLEIQYGWRPLIQDAYESMKAYSAITDKMRKTKISASFTGFMDAKTWDPVPNGYSVYRLRKQSVKYIATLTELPSPWRSLGLFNPAAVVWELIPFSFVADWFIPIGTYLDVLSTIPNLQGSFTRVIREVNTSTGIGYKSSSQFRGAFYSASQCVIGRSIETSISVPHPQFISPREALSVGRIKNGIALLHQQVSHIKI